MKPAVFYVIEDVGSVDFKNGRDFRIALHKRYLISHISVASDITNKQLF
jgi:hypothetical protein